MTVTKTADRFITMELGDVAKALGGGINVGSLVFIVGQPESGKSVLSQHLAHCALGAMENAVAYYTTENSANGLITQMESLSLHVQHPFLTGRLQVYPLNAYVSKRNGESPLHVLLNHISNLDERFNIVTLDSITPLIPYSTPAETLDFIRECRELSQPNRSIILVANYHSFEEQLLHRVYKLSDYFLMLSSQDISPELGQVNNHIIKVLEVDKVNGAELREIIIVRFEIIPNVGIQVCPFSKLIV